MVAHLLREQGVAGSNPAAPTKSAKHDPVPPALLLWNAERFQLFFAGSVSSGARVADRTSARPVVTFPSEPSPPSWRRNPPRPSAATAAPSCRLSLSRATISRSRTARVLSATRPARAHSSNSSRTFARSFAMLATIRSGKRRPRNSANGSSTNCSPAAIRKPPALCRAPLRNSPSGSPASSAAICGSRNGATSSALSSAAGSVKAGSASS